MVKMMLNNLISDNLCSEVVGTNGDVYSGTCNRNGSNFIYTIAFEKGSQARGNIVKTFTLGMISKDGTIISLDSESNEALKKDMLKEIICGF